MGYLWEHVWRLPHKFIRKLKHSKFINIKMRRCKYRYTHICTHRQIHFPTDLITLHQANELTFHSGVWIDKFNNSFFKKIHDRPLKIHTTIKYKQRTLLCTKTNLALWIVTVNSSCKLADISEKFSLLKLFF